MFGYVTVYKPELKIKDYTKYRAYYCGLCHVLMKDYGITGQLTLSYDMTFLVILLTSLYESDTDFMLKRCKVHPVKKNPMLTNAMTSYAAKMNIVMSYYHLVDDWNDDKSSMGLTGSVLLKKKTEKIEAVYPRQAKVIKEELNKITQYEKENCDNIDLVAGCFGRLMAEIVGVQEDMWEEDLRRIGFYLGKFIYIIDAWEDLDKDLKKGSYNPLKSLHETLDAKAYEDTCRQMLTMMMAEVSDAFERLPCLIDADILRNIIYAGVWTKYNKILSERYKTVQKNDKENDTRNDMENTGQKANGKMSAADKTSGSNADKIDKMIQDAANQMK